MRSADEKIMSSFEHRDCHAEICYVCGDMIFRYIFQEHTAGINCEKCEIGYYRPNGIASDSPEPCLPCDCNAHGSTGYCTPDDSYTRIGKVRAELYARCIIERTLIRQNRTIDPSTISYTDYFAYK